MNKFIKLTSLLLLCLASCKSSEKESYLVPEFKNVTTKVTEAISQPIESSLIYGLEKMGDYFIVLAPIRNQFVHIYDRRTGTIVSSGVGRGRANDELIFVNSYTFDAHSGKLSLYDATSKELLEVVITASGECTSGRKVMSNTPNFAMCVLPVDDNNLLLFSNTPAIDSIPRLSILKDGRAVSSYNEQPISSIDVSNTVYGQPRIALSPDKSKIVIGTVYGSILESYSVNNGGIKPIKTSYFIEPVIGANSIWGFSDIAASDDYIYAAYNGSSNINMFNKIAIFSWSHKPLELWDLNNCNIACVCVDNGDVYAIAETGDKEYRIVVVR